MLSWLKVFLAGPKNADADADVASFAARRQYRKKLLLFIHGLGGGPDDDHSAKYWGKFAQLAQADGELLQVYDIRFFSYPSAKRAGRPSTPVPISAVLLHNKLAAECRDYDTVDVIAHSQGGLITRQYIADRVKRRENVRIGKAIFYDTPNMGSALGKATELPVIGLAVSQELLDLAPGSAMLQALLRDEEASASHLVVPIRFVVAGTSRIVDRPSAWGIGFPGDYIVIPDRDHKSIIEPKDADDPVFVAAKSWLLDPAVRSGDDPAVITEQPLLSGKQFMETRSDDNQLGRFTYWHRAIPFKGRDAEIAQLDDFLDDPSRRFAWMLLSGVGGIGKSRLALEVVLRTRRDHWRAGFLDDPKNADYWGRWQPSRPTLLVIDYATKLPGPVGVVLKALAERPENNLLRRPVRLLLIEREAEDPRLDTMLAEARRTAGGDLRRPDLVLAQMDVCHVFESVLGSGSEIEAADAALTRIDKLSRRPLFAYLIADALKRGQDVRAWDRDALLNDVIAREHDLFWRPKAAWLGLNETDFKSAETALTLATVVGGLPLNDLPVQGDELLPRWNPIAHSQLFKDMTGRPVQSHVPALEPDIVGEFFVLDRLTALANLRLGSGKTMAEALVERAWSVDAWHTANFFDRIRQDFPEHALARALVSRPPPIAASRMPWSVLAFNLIHHLGADPATRAEALQLYQELKALAAAYPVEKKIRLEQVKAAVNLIAHLGGDPATRAETLQLYQELKVLAAAHPAEEEFRLQQAKAAVNLIAHLGADPATRVQALEIYQELKALAAAHPEENEVRLMQANAIHNLTSHLGADPATRSQALELYQDLKTPAAAHPAEKEIRLVQAKTAYCLIYDLGADPTSRSQALELYQDLKTLAAAHPAEKEIGLVQAIAAISVSHHLGADPATRAQTLELYQELKALAAAHPDETEIRLMQANAAFKLTHDLGADPVTRLQALEIYQELKALAAYPAGKEIRLVQAKAAVNLSHHLSAEPTTRVQALEIYQDLKALSAAHPEENEVRLMQASAILNLTSHLGADPASRLQALELYQELKALAAAHPEESEIRKLQGKAVFSLTHDLGADPVTRLQALEIYQELKALAAHPAVKSSGWSRSKRPST
jgi:hypothetical protein